jgi:hypothetical protein
MSRDNEEGRGKLVEETHLERSWILVATSVAVAVAGEDTERERLSIGVWGDGERDRWRLGMGSPASGPGRAPVICLKPGPKAEKPKMGAFYTFL